MNLGNTLRIIRKKKGFTLESVYNKTGYSASHLSLTENNKNEPSIKMLRKLAKVYNIPVPIIFFYSIEDSDIQKNIIIFKIVKPLIETIIEHCFYDKITEVINAHDDLGQEPDYKKFKL